MLSSKLNPPSSHLRLLRFSYGILPSCLSVFLTEVTLYVFMCFAFSYTTPSSLFACSSHVSLDLSLPLVLQFPSISHHSFACISCECFLFFSPCSLFLHLVPLLSVSGRPLFPRPCLCCVCTVLLSPSSIHSLSFSLPECYLPNLGSLISVCQ